MKAYVMTTGAVFGLLTVAHAWRMVEEGLHVAGDPWFRTCEKVPVAFTARERSLVIDHTSAGPELTELPYAGHFPVHAD